MKKLLLYVTIAILFSTIVAVLFSCAGGTKYYAPTTTIAVDSLYQITDEEIRSAFDAKPQLAIPVNLALYNLGFEETVFADSLESFESIQQVYPISPALIEGNAYYKRKSRPWLSHYQPPVQVNIRQLRLLAAQAKADLLLLYGIAFIENVETNGLVWTHVLIIPGLFMPSFHVNATAEVDLYFIDVRNNLLYTYQHFSEEFSKRWVNYWYTENLEKVRRELITRIRPKMLEITNEVLTNPEFIVDQNK
ncbi:MAG: hypothetical protein GWN62_29410 [Aliifodinibius sp.]|nr:hypothetical protein [Fodinibius sp.]